VKSIVKNDFLLNSINFFSDFGIKNNFKILMKNVNTVGKNEENYESSPETNLRGIVNLESSLPLVKTSDKFFNMLTPKISVRANPNNMKNNSNAERIVNVDNIFNINRLGLTDTVEAGNSLTLGLDYTKESTQDLNKFFELKFAGILRDAHEENIPLKSGINQKTSNLFGSAKYNLSEELSINYDFSIDNDLNTFERNKIGGNLTIKDFYTNISFIENNGKLGSSNVLENTLGYDFNDENSLLFRTRRNKEINLTEYYDLVYQYKNDCLVAGIKYKKTFYEDRELKPSEDLFFTISFFPITQFEQKIDQDAFRN
jgi:LPS-assembly protein